MAEGAAPVEMVEGFRRVGEVRKGSLVEFIGPGGPLSAGEWTRLGMSGPKVWLPEINPTWVAVYGSPTRRQVVLSSLASELWRSTTALVEMVLLIAACIGFGFSLGLYLFTPLLGMAALLTYIAVAIGGMALFSGYRKRKARHSLLRQLIKELRAS